MKVKEAQVLYNVKGEKTHVLIPYKKYEKLLELLDDALDMKSMDEVKNENTIPWVEAKQLLKKRLR